MKSKLVAIFAVLLVIVAVWWYRHEQSITGETWSNYQTSVGVRSEALEKKKSEILMELIELETIYSERMSGNAFLQILCAEPRSAVYREFYPLLAQQDMTAILNVSMDSMPGDKGCMSVKQAKKLIGLGWELSLEYDASYGGVAQWHEAISARLKTLGLEQPKNVYFRDSAFVPEKAAEFEAVGLTRFFHQNTAFGFYEPVNDNNPYWQINAISWNMIGVKTEMTTAIENGGDLIFTIGFEDERELYEEGPFSKMLGTIKDNDENGKLILAGFEEVEERRSEAANKYAAWLNDMLSEKERLKNELADVKAELNALY